jgi:hypothetical protein
MAEDWDAMIIISSTYIRMKIVTMSDLNKKREESAFEVVNPIESNLLVSRENHA